MILKRAKDYYENDKEKLKKQVRDKCRNLSGEGKKQKERTWKKNIKKIIVMLKSLNITINKTVLMVYSIIYAN